MAVPRSRSSRGATLMEILTVVTIVVLMAAIAVPMMMRAGFLSTDRRAGAARELYAFLRAARVYSATYNATTAVVYAGPGDLALSTVLAPVAGAQKLYVYPVRDEALARDRYCAGGMFMARRLTREEFNVLGDQINNALPEQAQIDYSDCYMALNSRNGNLVPMAKGTVAYFESGMPGGAIPDLKEDCGLTGVVVLDVDTGGGNMEWIAVDWVKAGGASLVDTEHAWAHIFKPSGEIAASTGKERYEFCVGLRPDANADDRFVDANRPAAALEEILLPIELYRSTGRVKIAER